jgi:hypothetical protein
LKLGHAGWSDLGHPERVITVLQTAGLDPWWLKEWQAKRSSATARAHAKLAVA